MFSKSDELTSSQLVRGCGPWRPDGPGPCQLQVSGWPSRLPGWVLSPDLLPEWVASGGCSDAQAGPGKSAGEGSSLWRVLNRSGHKDWLPFWAWPSEKLHTPGYSTSQSKPRTQELSLPLYRWTNSRDKCRTSVAKLDSNPCPSVLQVHSVSSLPSEESQHRIPLLEFKGKKLMCISSVF